MKYVFIVMIVLGISLVPTVFAENTLQNTNLIAESAVITLDIEFGADTIKEGLTKTWVTNHLDAITFTFYGDEIILTETELKTTSSGDNFRILSLPEGILIYGHKNIELGNYDINIYLATDNGLSKFILSSTVSLPDDKVVEQEPVKEKTKYIPELFMTFSHDFRTYWTQVFNIDVQSYDAKINDNPTLYPFEGRLGNANVTVLLSIQGELITTLQGVTSDNGYWDGEYYVPENISPPGEYIVDILLSYHNQTISETSSMFVIGTVADSGSTNNDYDDDGILNNDDLCPNDPEDFEGPEESNPPPVGDGCPES